MKTIHSIVVLATIVAFIVPQAYAYRGSKTIPPMNGIYTKIIPSFVRPCVNKYKHKMGCDVTFGVHRGKGARIKGTVRSKHSCHYEDKALDIHAHGRNALACKNKIAECISFRTTISLVGLGVLMCYDHPTKKWVGAFGRSKLANNCSQKHGTHHIHLQIVGKCKGVASVTEKLDVKYAEMTGFSSFRRTLVGSGSNASSAKPANAAKAE